MTEEKVLFWLLLIGFLIVFISRNIYQAKKDIKIRKIVQKIALQERLDDIRINTNKPIKMETPDNQEKSKWDQIARNCKHNWQPISFVFESQLLGNEGRVLVKQPNCTAGKVYCVCMKCHSHSYVETVYVGYRLNSPPDNDHASSLIYKDKADVTISADITQVDGKIELDFSSDCGKFGAQESLAGYKLTPQRLLNILNSVQDYTDDELF